MSTHLQRFPEIPLGESFDLEYGAAMPERERSGFGYPVFGSNGIVGRHSTFLIPGPGIVVGRKGSAGEVSWSSESFWPIDTAYYVVPKDTADLRWLYWLLTRTDLKRLDAATGVPGLNRNDVYALKAHRPPPHEQQRIAAVLDTIDEAIAKTEAVIAKLRQVRAGLLHDLLTRGLDSNGQLRHPILQPEHFQDTPLGRVPKEWRFESLGERLKRIAGVVQTGPFGSQLHAHEYTSDGVPVIMPQDILEGTITTAQIARTRATKADELKRHRVRVSDIVFARRGDLSRCAAITEREASWLCGTGCLLVRFGDATLSPYWLSLVYRHDIGQRQIAARAVGTTMVNLNTTLLSHLHFAFPQKEEQDEVVRRVARADANIAEESESLAKLGLIKSGLMTDLLTGRVRVPESIGIAP